MYRYPQSILWVQHDYAINDGEVSVKYQNDVVRPSTMLAIA